MPSLELNLWATLTWCDLKTGKQGHALVKARGFLGSVCVCLTSLLWCFDMCYWRPLFLARPATNLVSKFWPVPLWSMYRSSPFRSTLNTSYITALGMCKVCTEAVHSVALWTRVTLGLGMCKLCTEAVHSVARWPRVTLGLDMCKVCSEAVHSVALWTRVTLQTWACVKYVPKQCIP